MTDIIAALLKAIRQLADPAVLRILAKSLAITLSVFAVAGVGVFYALRAAFAYFGLADDGLASAAAAVIIAGIAFWFLFRIVALAVLQFFADEIVAAVEARHFPEAAVAAKSLPFRRDLANSVRGMMRALGYNLLALPLALALGFTGVGPALVFVFVNAVLLGRELTDMAWLRHCGAHPVQTPVAWSDRLMLGAAIAVFMLVPLLAFLAPVIGAAAGTHVTHRAMGASKNAAQIVRDGEI